MINKATLIGNLGKEPEVRRLENGTAVASFSVATTESYKKENGEWENLTEWHNIVVWRGGAEYCEKHLKKGSMVFVDGKITHRKYTDTNGIERYTTEIVANTCRLLEKKESNGQQTQSATPSVQTPVNDVFDSHISVISAGQKYRDREGVVLTIVSTTLNEIEFQSTKAAGVHIITIENWLKSIAPKYTLQEDNGVSDLPF